MKFLRFFLFFLFSSFIYATTHAKTFANEKTSIIFMIGDGMGPSYTTAYRHYQDNPETFEVEKTIFDELFTGKSNTYPDDKKNFITDSAAAATALATGVKTYNNAIAVDKHKHKLKTILELAKEQNYNTAMVVTSSIVHATPASFAAHIDNRNKYNEIADQYIDNLINGKPIVDLLFGGGKKFFLRKDRNIINEYKQYGYEYAHDWNSFHQLKSLPAIALLGDDRLDYTIESNDKTHLKTMTNKALALLTDKPFVLVIEGSLIDWCGHYNDIACTMTEMHDFAETIKTVKDYIDKNPNTVLVVTADHNTGGLSVGTDAALFSDNSKSYHWRPEVVKKINAFSTTIAKNLIKQSKQWQAEWFLLTSISLSKAEQQGFEKLITKTMNSKNWSKNILEKNHHRLLIPLRNMTTSIINKYSLTGWTGQGHTASDVEIFSYGQNKNNFSGYMDNTNIAKQLINYIK